MFKLGIVLGILVVLLVVTYFVVTSSAFLTGVILPRAGKAMNAQITVSSASISPWSEVVLQNFKIQPNGRETLVTAEQVHARYSLWDIIHGKIVVQEASLTAPVVTLVQNADGTSNLDPLLKQQQPEQKPAAPAQPAAPKAAAAPPQVDVRNVSLKNAKVEIVKNLAGGARQVTTVSGFDLALDQIQNGQPGKLTYSGNLSYEATGGTNQAAAGLLQAKFGGNFAIKFATNLAPESVTGSSRVDITKTGGSMTNLTALATVLDCDLTPTEIRKVSLHFEQSGTTLGELRVSGPFAMATTEGRLRVELLSVDRGLLNLVGGPMGMDFNKSAINSSNDIELKQKGAVIAVNGQFNIVDLSVTQLAKKLTTPTLNLQAAYQVNVDQNAKSALIQKLDLNGTENQQNFLHAALSKPMPVSWGTGAGMPQEAALDLVITNFNLADWQSFAADLAPAGTLNTTLHVVSKQGGKQLALDLASKLNNFGARFGSNQISRATIDLSTSAQVEDMKKVTLGNYKFQLAQDNQPALTLAGSGSVNLDTKDTNLKAVLDGQIPQLLKIVQMAGMSASSGVVHFDGQIAQSKDGQSVVGGLSLTNLSGTFGKATLDRFQTVFDTDLAVNTNELQIKKMAGTLAQAGQPAGSLNVSGTYNLTNKVGQVALKVTDINQNLLKPFVADALAGKELVSVSINANATASLQAGGSTSVQGDLGVTNLVVRPAGQTSMPKPLSAQFKLDASMAAQKVDLRQFQIALSPTDRAKNQIDIKGQVDMSKTNALQATIAVNAESIDVTPFYDLYAGGAKPAATAPAAAGKPATTPTPAPAAAAQTEPDAKQLPIQQAVVNLNIGKFYLRQIEITNWVATVKVEGSHVTVNPFQLALNGAPVSTTVDADLGVKGYTYQLTLAMDKVPLEPLANSFMTNTPGAYKGFVLANASIKGAGVTGPSLRSNLVGQASFALTNANIQLVNGVLPGFLTPIATALKIPDITTDPLNSVSAVLVMGQGKITVQTFNLKSAAFIADTHGDIQIADVLTNSPLSLPMTFSLSQNLVKNVPYLAQSSPSASGYTQLPDFIKVGGTLGTPKAQVNITAASAGTALLKGIGSQVGGTNTQGILKGLGGVLGGQSNTSTNAPATNAVAPAVNQLLNIFKKK